MDLTVSTPRPGGRLTPFVGGGLALLVAGSLVLFTMLAERADIGLGDPRGIIPTAPDATAQRIVVLPGSPGQTEATPDGTRVVAPLLPPIPIASTPPAEVATSPPDTSGTPAVDGPVVAAPRPDQEPSFEGPKGSKGPSFAPSDDGRGSWRGDGDRGATGEHDRCDDGHSFQGYGRGHCKHSQSDKDHRQQPAREEDSDGDDDEDDDDSEDSNGHSGSAGSHSKAGAKSGAGKAHADKNKGKKRADKSGHGQSNGQSHDSSGSD